MNAMRALLLFSLLSALAACQMDSRQQVLASANTQAAQRAISTRAFDTPDRDKVFQATIATLQDLGFIVDRADNILGTISATKYAGGVVRFTVTIRRDGAQRVIVRASGELGEHELSDPAPFQNFFSALSQALFLQANDVD